MGIIVLLVLVALFILGTIAVFKATFWLVDELHKDKPFGFTKPQNMASVQRPKKVQHPSLGIFPPKEVPKAMPGVWNEAFEKPPKPQRPKLETFNPGDAPKQKLRRTPPGKRKLDI